jgi:pimeloyl-ACP methyl ester carboxylesterase
MRDIPFIEVGTGADVLHFAHANAYPPGTYRQLLAALGARYRVLAVEHRPMWDNSDPWKTLTSWRPVADDLIGFLDGQGLSKIVGVGHSLGAVATFYAALRRPDLFRKLVLIEPVFLPAHFTARMDSVDPRDMPMVAGALRRSSRWENREALFERYRGKQVFARLSDESLWDFVNFGTKEVAGEIALAYPPEWEARFYAMPPRDVWELLPQLNVPTLAIRAEASDTLYPPAWALWQKKQPSATFIELADVGHLLTHEEPQKLAAIILDWLDVGVDTPADKL